MAPVLLLLQQHQRPQWEFHPIVFTFITSVAPVVIVSCMMHHLIWKIFGGTALVNHDAKRDTSSEDADGLAQDTKALLKKPFHHHTLKDAYAISGRIE
eukprot:5864166-Ditylum_brightwellii.AAC.1